MNVERLKSTLATGGEHLGDLIFWTLADARIDRKALESLWSAAQLSAELLPDPPTALRALKLAVREAQVGRGDCLIRLAKEDEAEVVFAIVREHRSGDGRLDYDTEARIRLDREHGRFSSDEASHDLVQAVKSHFDTYLNTHHPDDVRRALVKALHTFAAVTLREGGGIYWVPAAFAAAVRRLQRAVEQIGSSHVYLLPIHRSRDATHTLGELARGSLENELGGLKQEIAEFLATPPERASTLVRRFDAFEQLRSRARLYRDALHIEVQDLDASLSQLSTTVEQLLHQRSAA